MLIHFLTKHYSRHFIQTSTMVSILHLPCFSLSLGFPLSATDYAMKLRSP